MTETNAGKKWETNYLSHLIFKPEVQGLALRNRFTRCQGQSQNCSGGSSADPVEAVHHWRVPDVLHRTKHSSQNLENNKIEILKFIWGFGGWKVGIKGAATKLILEKNKNTF